MLNENLLCFILSLVVIVLLFYIFRVERFYVGLNEDEIEKAKTEILTELKGVFNSMIPTTDSTGNQRLMSDELKEYYEALKFNLESNLDETLLSNLLKEEEECLANKELLKEIEKNSPTL